MRAARFAGIALASALGLAACAPNRGAEYATSVAAARRAQSAGRYEEAARALATAATQARVPRDAVFARYEAALLWARAGDRARASRELRAIAAEEPPSAYAASAAFKAAAMREDTDPEAAQKERLALAARFSKHGVARVALLRAIAYEEEARGREAALALSERLTASLRGTELEQIVLYRRASLLEALGRSEAARSAFLELADAFPYPFGVHWDDALFRAAEIEARLGRPREAIALFERLLAERESAHFMGTYERPRYAPAMLRIADLNEEALNDRAAAREALHRFYKEFKTSTLRDDALFREAKLFRKDGDAAGACRVLDALVSDFPSSRYVPCASALCPEIARPKGSKAPTACRDYILRELGQPPPSE